MDYQIRYSLHWSGNYHVELLCIEQEICVSRFMLQQVLNIDYLVEIGCRSITLNQCMDMGFIFPSGFFVVECENVI